MWVLQCIGSDSWYASVALCCELVVPCGNASESLLTVVVIRMLIIARLCPNVIYDNADAALPYATKDACCDMHCRGVNTFETIVRTSANALRWALCMAPFCHSPHGEGLTSPVLHCTRRASQSQCLPDPTILGSHKIAKHVEFTGTPKTVSV